MPTIIELDIDAITEGTVARALLTLVAHLPDFEPLRYDLNQRGSFRGWDFERAIVDLLTQRTQFFVIEGEGGEVFIATGKHGEPPTMAFSFEVSAEVLDANPDIPVRALHHQ